MPLTPGTKLGQYEVVEAIGAGGMGEVYRARDTKLGRDVAIKVLPEEFSQDKERLARFEREARLLAQLNHSNIATLYGLEEHEGQQFLVMELVEGETLAARIAKGPIPIDEALPLFIELAEGLEAAHEKGIIHRDFKPANIKIGPDGKPKILDFGLAKAFQDEREAGVASSSQSPTLTKGTALGAIMGTASYMSPEQARGKTLDQRTDVWAFGCCLYEALSGKLAFAGETVPDSLTAVLGREPDFESLPPATPPRVRQLLERSLRKKASVRLQHIGDARIEISDALAEPFPDANQGFRTDRRRYGLAAVAVTALVTALVSVLVWNALLRSEPPARAVNRFVFTLPDGQQLVAPQGQQELPGRYPPVAMSQDGSKLVYLASTGGPSQLYLRDLDRLQARRLDETENAELPFFSPDASWVGFLVGRSIFKVPVDGGAPIKITDLRLSRRGAAWGPDDRIILGGANIGLHYIDADGGTPVELTQPNSERGEQYHAWPEVLPDGEHVLFSAVTGVSSDLGVLSLETGEWRLLERTEGATQPRYLDSGHLVFFRAGRLVAAPFDLSRMNLDGTPVQVLGSLFSGWNAGLELGFFAVSRSGSLVYVPGGENTEENRIVSVDREGREQPLPAEPGRYGYGPSLSRDGRRLAIGNRQRTSTDLWIHDLERGTRTRLTNDDANIHPVWTPDSVSILFSTFRSGGSFDVYSMPADGSAPPEPMLTREHDQVPASVSPDGRWLAFIERHPVTGNDIHLLLLGEDSEPQPFLVTSANERNARFSSDSRFLAYDSDETGRYEVYVRSVSGEGGKLPISTNGGRQPHWASASDELFYISGSTMMAVDIELGSELRAGRAKPLFESRYAQWWDVRPDGERFLMLTTQQADLQDLHVVVNWSTELERLVPTEN